MAKKTKRAPRMGEGQPLNEPRVDPTWRNAILLSVFAVLAIVSIFTVAIPELRDDGASDEADAAGTSEPVPSASAPDVSAPSAPAHSAPVQGP